MFYLYSQISQSGVLVLCHFFHLDSEIRTKDKFEANNVIPLRGRFFVFCIFFVLFFVLCEITHINNYIFFISFPKPILTERASRLQGCIKMS